MGGDARARSPSFAESRDEECRTFQIRARTENGDGAADDLGIAVGQRTGELRPRNLGAGEREDPQRGEAAPLVGVALVGSCLVDDATSPPREEATCSGLCEWRRRRSVGRDSGERSLRQACECVLRRGSTREPAVEHASRGVERQARDVEEGAGDDDVRRDTDPDEGQRAEGERVGGEPGSHS